MSAQTPVRQTRSDPTTNNLPRYSAVVMSNQQTQPDIDLRNAVFFPEGPGFLLVRLIEEGMNGHTMIVRGVNDGKLYIRKETPIHLMASQHIIQSSDVRNGLKVAQIPNTAKLVGWAEYHDRPVGNTFTASYWEYYNSGTFADLSDDCVDEDTEMSEQTLWKAFSTMLTVLLDFHAQGLVHDDAHAGNWFLHYDEQNRVFPKIVLGDFGDCKELPNQYIAAHDPENDVRIHIWNRLRRADFNQILVALTYPIIGVRYVAGAERSIRARAAAGELPEYSTRFWDLFCEFDEMCGESFHGDLSSWFQRIANLRDRVNTACYVRVQMIPPGTPSVLVPEEPHHLPMQEFLYHLLQLFDIDGAYSGIYNMKAVKNGALAELDPHGMVVGVKKCPQRYQTYFGLSRDLTSMPEQWQNYHRQWFLM